MNQFSEFMPIIKCINHQFKLMPPNTAGDHYPLCPPHHASAPLLLDTAFVTQHSTLIRAVNFISEEISVAAPSYQRKIAINQGYCYC